MAHSRPPKGRTNKVKRLRRSQLNSKPKSSTPTELLNEATAFLHTGDPEAALPLALRALVLSQVQPHINSATHISADPNPAAPARESLPALKLLAEINLELGDAETARDYFLQAVDIDPEGEVGEDEGGGAEKFLWLAQLCEEGGEESVRWFERGADVLRREIAIAEEENKDRKGLDEMKKRLAGALCGIIEVYMTDLSFEPTAEVQCTTLIANALALAPKSPTPHQTHASILISQSDLPAARTALRTSLSLWQHLPPSHPDVLDFPSRISLSRLLLEVGMEDEALEVLSSVVEGDESSVEGWYLGGWGLWLLAEKGGAAQQEPEAVSPMDEAAAAVMKENDEKRKSNTAISQDHNERIAHLRDSRTWLTTCLMLASQLDYEDARLRDHAQELVQNIERILLELGLPFDDDDDDKNEKEEEAWDNVDSSDDDEHDDREKDQRNKSPEKISAGNGGEVADQQKRISAVVVTDEVIMSGT